MHFPRFLARAWFLAFISLPAWGADWKPDPSVGNIEQHHRLYEIGRAYADANFDPDADLVGVASVNGPMPNKKIHSFRESAVYAYGLFLTGDPIERALAQKILKRVLAAQDIRPGSSSNGAFLWYTDQQWQTQQNPDLNSAAFVGVVLADIIDLDRRHPCLAPDLRRHVETALKLSIAEIIRRNVDTNYTNIALLSAAATAAGAKFWNMPDAALFAQSKLDTVLGLAGNGVCYEYLAPTYTAVDFEGAYLARKFAFSEAFAAQADAMIGHLWKEVAAAYHAPTYNLGGPFGRAYGDDMLTYAAGLKYFLYLGLDGDYPLSPPDPHRGPDQAGLMLTADLPILARPEFKLPVPAWRQFTAVGGGQWPERHLSQYRGPNFILGTVAFQDEWLQKRNLVAYWRSDLPAPRKFRVGFCIDESNETLPVGFPYSRIHFYCQQNKDAALVALATDGKLPGQGGSCFVFDDAAAVDKSSMPIRVKDGAYTAFIYPVSSIIPGFNVETDAVHHMVKLLRPWNSADTTGALSVISYLIVFRPSDQPAPTVSDLELKAASAGVSAHATVNGAHLSVSFVN